MRHHAVPQRHSRCAERQLPGLRIRRERPSEDCRRVLDVGARPGRRVAQHEVEMIRPGAASADAQVSRSHVRVVCRVFAPRTSRARRNSCDDRHTSRGSGRCGGAEEAERAAGAARRGRQSAGRRRRDDDYWVLRRRWRQIVHKIAAITMRRRPRRAARPSAGRRGDGRAAGTGDGASRGAR
jgi:hypothetical protein